MKVKEIMGFYGERLLILLITFTIYWYRPYRPGLDSVNLGLIGPSGTDARFNFWATQVRLKLGSWRLTFGLLREECYKIDCSCSDAMHCYIMEYKLLFPLACIFTRSSSHRIRHISINSVV